jgi:hypothetical protein
LSALADTRRKPLARIYLTQEMTYMMIIAGRVLHGQVTPVARLRRRLQEVSMLYENEISLEQCRQLLLICRIQGIRSTIPFGYHHCRTVKTTMLDDDTLAEGSLSSIIPI